jgi:aminopeptidase N
LFFAIMRLFLFLFLLAGFNAAAQHPHSCQQLRQAARMPSVMSSSASNERSDTLDILNYTIRLSITDFTNQQISGNTSVRFTPLMNNVTVLPLDLLELTVDSVTHTSGALGYTYNDTLLRITLPAAMNPGDTSEITVWYHGQPEMDASGWGGFYFQSGYAFNLGVGFDADPHNYGRVWHPCFDNFVERATYRFEITTNSGRLAYCNGILVGDTTDVAGFRTRTWAMNQTIPTYLASVAVAAYTQVNWLHAGVNGTIPIQLVALPADTTPMKNSFVNLPGCIDAFEDFYAPHPFSHIGYCLVPFSSGAMEHATNIAYPRAAANGSLTYEAVLMAHEFAHHWWGDLATCRTAEDMWLNEGWATYSGYIFREWVYGYADYQQGIRENHDDIIHYVHLREGGYRAVSGVPHAYTYGDHVYQKGSDVAHSLRGYMGDSLFKIGLNYHLNQSQFKDVSSEDFRDNLIAATGLTYLTDFFDDWVFNPGFPHFSIDSVTYVGVGPNTNATVHVKQKLRGAPNYYTNVPLEITFFGAAGEVNTQRMFVSGATSVQTFTLSFQPVYAAADFNNKLSDAVSDESRNISTTGASNFALGRINLTVTAAPDTAFVHITHNWAAPDPMQNNPNNYRLGQGRYFSVGGIWPAGFSTDARMYYDGRTSSLSGPAGWFDNDLMPVNGDSVILLYRRSAADEWQEFPRYTKTRIGSSATSKYGYFSIDSLVPGEYCYANGVSTVLIGIDEETAEPFAAHLGIYPNPAQQQATLNWPETTNNALLIVTDGLGRTVFQQNVSGNQFVLNTSAWSQGFYEVQVRSNGKLVARNRLVVE